MSWPRRRKAAPQEASLNAPPVGGAPAADVPGEDAGKVDTQRLRDATGPWAIVKQLIVGYGVAAGIFVVAALVAGWEWALVLSIVIVPIVWIYTRRVHKEPWVRILVAGRAPGTGAVLIDSYLFPPLIFGEIHTEGISNSVMYRGQLTYLAEWIEWDKGAPRLLPVKVHFAWIHLNTLNFLFEHDILVQALEALESAVEESTQRRLLSNVDLALRVPSGVEETMNLLFEASEVPGGWAKSATRDELVKKAEELRQRVEGLQLGRKKGQPEDEIISGGAAEV